MKTDVKQKKQTLQQLIDSLQQGGSGGGAFGPNYVQIGDIRLYVSSTQPTGDIPDGSIGVGW